MRVTAVVSAVGQSAARTLSVAECNAAIADEHAVSMLSHGPCSPRVKEMRPAAIEMAPPVAA